MREKLKALSTLQKLDVEILSLQKTSGTYPKQLSDLERELAAARGAIDLERQRLVDLERQKSELERNIADEKEKVKKWEARLAEQRSTREYAALAREIDIAKKSNLTMAEQLVELGKTIAAAREAVHGKEQQLVARRDEISVRVDALKARASELGSQASELEGQRATVVTAVDADLLRKYDSVRKKRMPALVPLLPPGTCQGCNMNVPPQLYNTLHATRGTGVCPSCHRLIYTAELAETPTPK